MPTYRLLRGDWAQGAPTYRASSTFTGAHMWWERLIWCPHNGGTPVCNEITIYMVGCPHLVGFLGMWWGAQGTCIWLGASPVKFYMDAPQYMGAPMHSAMAYRALHHIQALGRPHHIYEQPVTYGRHYSSQGAHAWWSAPVYGRCPHIWWGALRRLYT